MKISAIILTKNEEKNIEKCLRSIRFCEEVIIIDDNSTDKTTEIINKVCKVLKIKKYRIYKNELNNDFAQQRNFGLNKASCEWILFIDADEEVSEGLKKEITLSLNDTIKENAFYIKRRDYFWKKELKYGEVKKIREKGIVRLVKKNSGTWMGSVHEVFYTAKNVGQLNSFLNHYPHPTLKEFIGDINRYSEIRASELFVRGKKTNAFEIISYPFGKFIYNYFINLGFLDGPEGFTYAFMMSFHSFLVRAKLYQLINTK